MPYQFGLQGDGRSEARLELTGQAESSLRENAVGSTSGDGGGEGVAPTVSGATERGPDRDGAPTGFLVLAVWKLKYPDLKIRLYSSGFSEHPYVLTRAPASPATKELHDRKVLR